MCGVVGWYRRGDQRVDIDYIDRACNAIAHRGPDDRGLWTDGNFGFGMQRLSILDLAGGHQPMTSPDGETRIVYNGEIYNHLALREALIAQGVRFQTTCDTETILHGFKTWGDALWPKLEGMFAIAIWHQPTRTLHLARDPLGIKPLFITAQNGGLAFASEMKSLFQLPQHDFIPDPQAVHDYFCFGHNHGARAIYQNVSSLPPGYALTLSAEGEAQVKPFWQFRFDQRANAQGPQPSSETEWIEAFRSEWTQSIERHMLSDVPVGVFLSGGVDSAAVAAGMKRCGAQALKAFTIGFPVSAYDETPAAAALAAHLGFEHVTRQIEARDAADLLPQIVACYDAPFADPSAIPTWALSQLASEHVKVTLSGDGGDELFAGYTRHRNERLVQRWNALPAALRALGKGVNMLPPLPFARWNYQRQRLQSLYEQACLPSAAHRFFSKTQVTSAAFRKAIYTRDFAADVWHPTYDHMVDGLITPHVSDDPVEQFLHADTTIRLPNVMLTKVDRAAMAHSLEVRTPFLSHIMADFAARVPIDLKLRGSTGKYLVREAITPWLPDGHLNRPKQGFSMPLSGWLRGDFGSFAQDVWRSSKARDAGYLAPTAVDTVFKEHRSGRADHSLFLYALAVFCLWWEAKP